MWFARKLAATARLRRLIPYSPANAKIPATTKSVIKSARSCDGRTASTKTIRNPRTKRKTTTAYSAAVAKSGRNGMTGPRTDRHPLTLRRKDVANVDGLASSQIDHLSRIQPRGPDRTGLAAVPDDDVVPRSDLRGRVAHADREDVAPREEVFDFDPVGVLSRQEFPSGQRQGKHPVVRVHRDLHPFPNDSDEREAATERSGFDEAQTRFAELKARDVHHFLREPFAARDRMEGRTHAVQCLRQGGEGLVRGRALFRGEDRSRKGRSDDRRFRAQMRDDRVVVIRRDEGLQILGHDRGLVSAPVARHRDVVGPGGVEALELARDQAQRRCDDDLVDEGGVCACEDRVAETSMAATRGVRFPRRTREEEENPSGRRLAVSLANPPPEPHDLWPGQGLVRVCEHLAAHD